jgi:hypothetical protein
MEFVEFDGALRVGRQELRPLIDRPVKRHAVTILKEGSRSFYQRGSATGNGNGTRCRSVAATDGINRHRIDASVHADQW